jgi:ABC-type phosphate/phosphonate transport system substrate-binding protein
MTTAETEVRASETQLIEGWRAERLELAGYTPSQAAEIATRQDIDLHTAVDLVGRGCPAELALKILL